MEESFPTLQQQLDLRMGSAAIMLLQTKEQFSDSTTSRKVGRGKYLAL